MSDDIIRKLKKLLALAGNNSNENERARAMEAAHELALKHNMDLTALPADQQDGPEKIMHKKRMERWQAIVYYATAEVFFCIMLQYVEKKIRYPVFVGRPHNVAITIEVASYLLKSIRTEAKRIYGTTSGPGRQFCLGAASGLKHKSVIVQVNARARLKGPTAAGTALMVRDKLADENKALLDSMEIGEVRKPRPPKVDENFANGYFYSQRLDFKAPETRQIEVKSATT